MAAAWETYQRSLLDVAEHVAAQHGTADESVHELAVSEVRALAQADQHPS